MKLLKGYGCSIRMKGNKVILRGGSDPFTGEAETEEFFVTQIPYERIVVSGKGYVSTEAIGVLSRYNVNVILLDSFGNLITNMCKTMSSDTGTKHRIAQYDTFRNPEKVRYLQKKLLFDKISSQQHFLREIKNRMDRTKEKEASEIISRLSSYAEKISSCKEKRDLLRIEAGAGRIYFLYYTSLFDSKYGFISRNGGGIKTGNRYASDVINALLNYGYSVLAAEIAKFVHGFGLDPYYGFFHKVDTSFQALVYDLIEPFRWLVEYAVYKIASDTNHNHRITKKDYAWTREGKIVIDDGLIKRFLELLERKFQSERPYRFNHGLKRKDGMSMCQEITIAKIEVQKTAEYCVGGSNIQLCKKAV